MVLTLSRISSPILWEKLYTTFLMEKDMTCHFSMFRFNLLSSHQVLRHFNLSCKKFASFSDLFREKFSYLLHKKDG
jgi:hypothetical protein